jgi:hypothetical protein
MKVTHGYRALVRHTSNPGDTHGGEDQSWAQSVLVLDCLRAWFEPLHLQDMSEASAHPHSLPLLRVDRGENFHQSQQTLEPARPEQKEQQVPGPARSS